MNKMIPGWCALLLSVSLKSCFVFASEPNTLTGGSKPGDVVITETPIEPVMLDGATTPATKVDPDGTSVSTLQYVAVITRHGDRYKAKNEFFENDPFKMEDPFWMPHGMGQLRNAGKFRMYSVGQVLRHRYNGFIKEEYYYSSIKFVSPDLDRCLMSAQLVSQGMFPPKGINIWNDNVGKSFQPIPIRSLDASQDIVFNDEKLCPPYEKELKKILSQEMKEINEKYGNIYEYVAYHTGRNITNLQHINDVYQALRIEKENGRDLPEWTKPVFPSKLKALAGLYNQVIYYNDKMKRIKAGPIFNEILNDFNSKTSHLMERRLKMKVWTGFDSTLLKILHTLRFKSKYDVSQLESVMQENVDPMEAAKPVQLDDIMETSYGSTLMLELHFINRTYFVKAVYLDNGYSKTPKVLKLKECDDNSLIPYEMFVSRYQKYAISDEEWNKRCGVATC